MQERNSKMTVAILSLSLLTVMAGAAVAPVLNVIQDYFSDTDRTLVQMIISIPALFIVFTSLIFPKLSARFGTKHLLMAGLLLYTAGGCIAGIFENIYLVLATRALVGIGVGIIMPMSTGLIAYYYSKDRQDKLMGYSSAMNQLGGSIATLISGLLAVISWRLGFLVYLMGMISIVLCLLFLPNENIRTKSAADTDDDGGPADDGRGKGVFATYFPLIIGMFLLNFAFFIYPSNFAIESAKDGDIAQQSIAVIMALMDACGFLGGLAFATVKKNAGRFTKMVSPAMLIIGYLMLIHGGMVFIIIGSVIVGFAAGAGIPYYIATASHRAGKAAVSTVLPALTAALYLAQFLTPIILNLIENAFAESGIAHISYCTAAVAAAVLIAWTFTIREE